MTVHETYFALALAWSIKTDFDFVKWLVDIRAFPENSIDNSMTRALYTAAARSYARAAPRGSMPNTGDVVLELSTMVGDEVATTWGNKIAGMEKPPLSEARSVANKLSEAHDRDTVIGKVSSWLSGAKSGKTRESIYGSFTGMTDEITRALVGEQKTGKPGDILERSWAAGIRTPESTGYERLDKAISGGWIAGSLYILGMPSGHGKSSMSCNFASRRAEMGLPTLINSFEMSADDMLFRMLCDLAEVTIDVAENPSGAAQTNEEYERVMRAMSLLDSYVRIYDTQADSREIDRRIRRHRIEFRGETILSILDHIGIIRRDGRRRDSWEELESMTYALSGVAKENNIPILANSQVPAEMEAELVARNMVIYNRDFRGSRGIRNAVDYAIVGCKHNGLVDSGSGDMVHDFNYRDHTVLQVIKNRKTGGSFWGVFQYDPMHYRLMPTRSDGTNEDIYA